MKKVRVLDTIKVAPDSVWELITDLDKYPKYVKFVKSVSYEEKLRLGSSFYDITKIVWLPIKIKHTVDIFEENKKLGYFVKMPFGGEMYQRVVLKPLKEGTEVDLSIEFTHGNPISDLLFAPILSKRLKEMLEFIVERGKKDFEQ